MKKPLSIFLFLLGWMNILSAQQADKIVVVINEDSTYQTIQNFAASDAWACQFVGSWPEEKKNTIADWLFSMDTFSNGNPKGIGLSLWRYNLGAGSAEQHDSSGIHDEWRRASLTISDDKKVQAQNWFLMAAKQRGVQQFLGFFNSPPVQFTKNKKAFADKGKCNIDSIHYRDFASYAVNAIRHISKVTGITFNYISPVNEPQWDWSDGGQEGCPYTNVEISHVAKAFNNAFGKDHLNTKLLLSESGHLKYMLPANDKPDKDNQVYDFFNAASPLYVGNLSHITPAIASHSYFTTSPFNTAMMLRTKVKDSIVPVNNLVFWQSEYCILGDNNGEINGDKKDLGMDAALYVAKVIYEDMVGANASAWQWWTALSPYNYKDGLIYIDKNETDGNYSDSKMMWAMGNYSRFVRPGMKRISVDTVANGLLVSGYADSRQNRVVLVCVNESANEKPVTIDKKNSIAAKKATVYTTDAMSSLVKKEVSTDDIVIPAKSVVTIIFDKI